jgi:hypothetical protein
MKKLLTLTLGMALALGTVSAVFGQETPKKEAPKKEETTKKKNSKKKDTKKKEGETEKKGGL